MCLAAAAQLSVELNVTTGAFTISRDGAVWFQSNVTAALRSSGAWLSSQQGGGLPLDGPASLISGDDAILGEYSGWAMSFGDGLFDARIKVFSVIPGIGLPIVQPSAIVFEQNFPRGIQNSSGGTDETASYDLSTAFPALTLPAPPSGLAYASWSGGSANGTDWPMFAKVGTWDVLGVLPGRLGFMGSVTAVYNASLAVCAFSPMDNFMTQQAAVGPSLGAGVFGVGLSARVASIPQGFTASSILVAGQGINDTVTALGSVLLAQSGKTRVVPALNQVRKGRFSCGLHLSSQNHVTGYNDPFY